MAGTKTVVATRINEIESRAHLTHCCGYALQLAVYDSIKFMKIMRATFHTAFELNSLSNILWFQKHRKKNQILSKMGRSFQQTEGRHCTRKLC